ncbi:MAG: DUF4923 family protein [Bacteroidetes bacterium]|nr:DUF4923 family protein [Bacteroidota bacterium]MDA1118894.1 DUF4923 family protein [Bacteroidota bacterium]
MKNVIRNLFLIAMSVTVTMLTGCGGDESDPTEAELVGTWNTTDTAIEILVDGQDVLDWLTDQGGLSSFEAKIAEQVLEEGLSQGFEGTITFNSDGTYITIFEDETDGGQWALAGDKVTLTSDQVDEVPVTLTILKLNSSTLIVELKETESEDLDEDGAPEEFSITIEMTLNKQ